MAPTITPIDQSSASQSGSALTDRRRRSRVSGETLAWILPVQPRLALHLPEEDQSWEVRVYNVSRLGIGFTSTQAFALGGEHRIRIGRGPARRARLIRVVACRESDPGLFSVGAEFVDAPAGDLARAG